MALPSTPPGGTPTRPSMTGFAAQHSSPPTSASGSEAAGSSQNSLFTSGGDPSSSWLAPTPNSTRMTSRRVSPASPASSPAGTGHAGRGSPLFGGTPTAQASVLSGSPPGSTTAAPLHSGLLVLRDTSSSPGPPAAATAFGGSQTAGRPSRPIAGIFGEQPPAPTGNLIRSGAAVAQRPSPQFQFNTGKVTGEFSFSAGGHFGEQPPAPTGSLIGSGAAVAQRPLPLFQFNAGKATGQPSSSTGGLFGDRTAGQPTTSPSPVPSTTPTQESSQTMPPARLLERPSGPSTLFDKSRDRTSPASTLASSVRLLSLDADVGNTSSAPQLPPPVEAYNILDEQLQLHDFFSPLVSGALADATKILEDLTSSVDTALQQRPEDEGLTSLRSRISGSSGLRHPLPRQIAVLGDSGQGKSSLINSLLHTPDIAHTSDAGSACTSVVIEYHHKPAQQKSPISIHVDFYSGVALEDLVKELAWSYRQLYLPDTKNSALTSEQDYAKYQKQSEEAWSALHAAFQHHATFSAEFLRDVSEGAEDRINQQLIQWAHAIQWPSGGRNSGDSTGNRTLRIFDVSNAEECREKSRVFMADGLWPFTRIIQQVSRDSVFLSSPILEGGVILADLPGLHDTNLARVKATQDYLLRCDKILIVSKISRAITDQSVRSSLFSVVSRHMPMEWNESRAKKLSLAVVCTEADRINIKTATADFSGEGKRISPEQMRRLEADLQTAKASGDYAAKKLAKRRLEFALIAARAAHVEDALRQRYSEDAGGHLDVFCVGNEAYGKYCRKGNAEFVKASGIPSLRQFCLKIAADDRLLDGRHFTQSQIPSLLNSADLWASSNFPHGAFDEMDKANMLDHVKNIQSQVPAYVEQLRNMFVECFEEQIMNLWTYQEHKWQLAALDASKEWEQWRWRSYNAWCRHNGKHSTTDIGSVDWNAKIIWKMRMELEFQWDIVEEEVPHVFTKLTECLSNELKWLKEDTILKAAETPHRDLLISSIDAIDRLWSYNLAVEEHKLRRGLVRLRKQVSESNETSYIMGQMIGTYRTASARSVALSSTPANVSSAAEEEIGQGIFELQKRDITGRIGSDALFANMAIRLAEDVEALAAKTEESVGILVKQVMERLEYDVKMALKEGENVGGVENEATVLKKAVDRLRDRMEELPRF